MDVYLYAYVGTNMDGCISMRIRLYTYSVAGGKSICVHQFTWMYAYLYVYLYVYICMYTYMYIYMYIYTYISVCIHICMSICISICIHLYVYIYTHIQPHSRTCMFICARYIHRCVRTYIHIQSHLAYIYIYPVTIHIPVPHWIRICVPHKCIYMYPVTYTYMYNYMYIYPPHMYLYTSSHTSPRVSTWSTFSICQNSSELYVLRCSVLELRV